MEGFAVRLEVRHKIPVEHRLAVRFQFLHQFALDGQQVVKADKDIRAPGYLFLHRLVVPRLDDRALPHASVAFLLRRQFGMQGLVQLKELVPDDGVATVYRVFAVFGVGVDEFIEPLADVLVQVQALQGIGGNGIIEEIRHLFCRHRGIHVREVGDHLPAPAVEHVQRHEVCIPFVEAAVMTVKAHDGKQFILGVQWTEGIL